MLLQIIFQWVRLIIRTSLVGLGRMMCWSALSIGKLTQIELPSSSAVPAGKRTGEGHSPCLAVSWHLSHCMKRRDPSFIAPMDSQIKIAWKIVWNWPQISLLSSRRSLIPIRDDLTSPLTHNFELGVSFTNYRGQPISFRMMTLHT